ncbi:uncharacterized protein [Euwallacea fornicatus]|uniref:uncharacterized protein n=1 Tax=Euwallacea fornicatus TaxID=995702 RepID=UPI00338DCEFC
MPQARPPSKIHLRILRTSKKKPKNRGIFPTGNHQKSSRECINFLAIMGCLLIITGMTLLNTYLPSNYVESADTKEFHNHVKEVYEHGQSPSFEKVASGIQSAKDVIDTTKSMNIFDSLMRNLTEETCEPLSSEIFNKTLSSEDLRELKTQVIVPYYDKLLRVRTQLKSLSIDKQLKMFTKSLSERAKELMKSTSFQIFVATLMQDICLVKLISELSKRAKMSGKDKEERNRGASTEAKKATKPHRKKRIKRSALKRIKNKDVLAMPAKLSAHDRLNLATENGKSECEKGFEELESRWSALEQSHRETVQQIKDTFQKKMNEIKEREIESFNRQQRIQVTRDEFIQRLKAHREAFLHGLRKLRNERKKLLHEICYNFKKYRDWSNEDISAGNCTIVLPDGYDFVKKLEAIKNKERYNLQTSNDEAFSYIPAKELESTPHDEIPEEPLLKSKNKLFGMSVRPLEQIQAKKGIKEFTKVAHNVATAPLEAASKPLVSKLEEAGASTPQPAPEEAWPHDEAYEAVRKRKKSKRDLSKLYEVTFEKQSEKIKKQDVMKWGKKLKPVPLNALSKQDPSKAQRQKIMRKGLL